MVYVIPRADVARDLKTHERVTCRQLKKIQLMYQLKYQRQRTAGNLEILMTRKYVRMKSYSSVWQKLMFLKSLLFYGK